MSGIEALNKLTEKYKQAGKKLHLKHLSDDCRVMLKNAADVIVVNIMEDPAYHVATEKVR
jgi:SulP family sulfate permease